MTDSQTAAALLRADLSSFVEAVFHTVSPADTYLHNWHIDAICYELGLIRDGGSRQLIISQPPRSLKSICTSVAYVAWALGHDPHLHFICVSYSSELASVLSRQFRTVVTSDWYQKLFPDMRLAKDTETECSTTRGGGRVAVSVGGTLTGRGADQIIIDDPMKADEAQSETARRTVLEWYSQTLVSRLNDKEKGAIVLVMQRLHEDDLAGHLIENGGWRHLDLPAIAIEDQNVPIDALDYHHRDEGDVLHPERESRETLERIKQQVGSLVFSAQYQQRPVPIEGNLVKRDWFKTYSSPPEPAPGVKVVQSWDIAGTITETADYSVCTTWAMRKKEFYLLDVWRGRLEYPDLKRKVVALQQSHDAQSVLIEKAGLGLSLVQDLENDSARGFPNPIGIVPKGDKLTRLEAETARIEGGHVFLPGEAPWLDTFLNEILAFPTGKYDDQVDSLSQFLEWAWRKSNRRFRVGARPQIIRLE